MIKGQLSIFDFIQEERLADRYHDGIPDTIQEVVEKVEQRTGLKFKERKPYKSIIGVYQCEYKKAKFELKLGRFAEGVHHESRYISTDIEYGLWGRSVPAYDIDETIKLVKRWKEQIDDE